MSVRFLPEWLRIWLSRSMQLVLVALFFIGVFSKNIFVAFNSVMSLIATFIPAILERDRKVTLKPMLAFWITAAVFFHTLGTLGPYESIWWWDNALHAFISLLIAGIGYGIVRAIDEHYEEIFLPPQFMFVFILIFTMAAGVLWEILEFGLATVLSLFSIGAPLIQYGLADTMSDLVYDMIGGLFVALGGHIYFQRLTK